MRHATTIRTMALLGGLMAAAAQVGAAAPEGHAHQHPTEGPRHGTLIELGREDYHAELLHDEATDTVTIHLLDGGATKAVPIAAKQLVLNMRAGGKPQQFSLPARPQPGDPAGSASAFATTSRELCQALDTHGASGRLNVEIGGKAYVGKVGDHVHPHPH